MEHRDEGALLAQALGECRVRGSFGLVTRDVRLLQPLLPRTRLLLVTALLLRPEPRFPWMPRQPEIRAVLLYGPDRGLVSERLRKLSKFLDEEVSEYAPGTKPKTRELKRGR